jgi:predicted aconitase
MLKEMGAATASAGAVGLYHVEDLTPEAKELGRDLLAEGYQTYVIDDAELDRVYATYPNPWPEDVKKPTAAYIGCPHNTYHELEIWSNAIHKAMKEAGKDEIAIPTAFMVSRVVSDAFFLDNPELYRDLYAMGVRYSNTCVVCFGGMAGYDEENHVVTNSNKARKYTPARFVPKMEDMVHIIVTGEMPA